MKGPRAWMLGWLGCSLLTAAPLKVMQFNIWQEGTSVEGGLDKIVEVILRSGADVVAFSEVRNYRGEDWHTKLLARLAARGQHFHGRYVGGDVGLVSRLPIQASGLLVDPGQDRGSLAWWKLDRGEKGPVMVASAHLDYRHYALNLVRGYQAGDPDWKARGRDGKPEPVREVPVLLDENARSQREPTIRFFLGAAAQWSQEMPVVLAGDFNEASHRDWSPRARHAFGHEGVAIPWPCSVLLEAAGFEDVWRAAHPDELTHPGFTWPSPAHGKPHTSWAPLSDERDRVDFIFVKGLKVRSAWVVGPGSTLCRNTPAKDPESGEILLQDQLWPSDHKAVLAELD